MYIFFKYHNFISKNLSQGDNCAKAKPTVHMYTHLWYLTVESWKQPNVSGYAGRVVTENTAIKILTELCTGGKRVVSWYAAE